MPQKIQSEEPAAFDLIIEEIGNAGPFQKRFNIVFNFFLVIAAVMANFNLIISLATPDHWCHVPGREYTTYSMKEWKDRNIPKELDSRGLISYSKCRRYAIPYSSSVKNTTIVNVNLTKCDRGWDYDRTWYDWTAPMQNNWVCDDSMVPANTLAIDRFGEVIGTLIFGQLADNYGRRPIFFVLVVTLVIGRVMSIVTSATVYAFMFFSVISSLPGASVYQGPMVIAMEISRAEDRAWISMMQGIGCNAELVIMPLLMWWLRDWETFVLATTLPCALFLFFRPWIIESPRWLASKGKIKQCYKELEIVAKTNKTEMPSNTEDVLKKTFDTKGDDKLHSILALFSSPRLAKNTILLVTCWTILLLIYMCLTINVSNLSGNPFLNYIFQACAQLPAFPIGKYVSNRYGRRWATILSFVLTFFTCIPILLVVNDASAVLVISAFSALMKFSVSLAYYSVNLQGMEIYPTCVRQTGIAFGAIVGSCFGVLSPYIVALGTSVNAMLPYIIYAVSALLAAISCLFLPETCGHQLPESLADASNFGADQNIWGKSKSRQTYNKDGAKIPLRQTCTKREKLRPSF